MRTFVLVTLAAVAGAASAQSVPGLRYIGQQTLPTGTVFQGTQIGGLSGIDFDARDGTFWSISDDRSSLNPARFYNLSMNYDQNGFYGVNFNSTTVMRRPDGTAFPTNEVDPEAIRLDPSSGRFLWTSEGERLPGTSLQNPFVREMNADGSFVREFSTPARFNPTAGNFGLRRNLAFESLTLSTDGQTVYTATENALFQDGPASDTANASPCRVVSYDKATGLSGAEYVYVCDPVLALPNPPGSFTTNGLVELMAVGNGEFLALERSFSTGVGNSIRIYLATIGAATDVSGFDTLPGAYTAMTKSLLLNVDTLGITLDNIEGISWGPVLPNGSRSIVLCSDNNFASTQFTQFIAFEVVPSPSSGGLALVALIAAGRRRR
ncbi:MAG: esterase-like activity of phytase family protein [Phycisphaerales bacterium]